MDTNYNFNVGEGWTNITPNFKCEKKYYIANSCCCDSLKNIVKSMYEDGNLYFCYGEAFSYGINEIQFFAYTNKLDFEDLWKKRDILCIVIDYNGNRKLREFISHGLCCSDFVYHKLLVS